MKALKSKNTRLTELAEGNLFDEDELIIERDEDEMTTLRKIDEDEIRKCYYRIFTKNGILNVDYNGFKRYFPGDIYYEELNLKLKEAGL